MTLPKTINIVNTEFTISTYKGYGANFTIKDRQISIGTSDCDEEILISLIHEISEIIHVLIETRLVNNANDSYIFLLTHKEFQIHNELLIKVIRSNKLFELLTKN